MKIFPINHYNPPRYQNHPQHMLFKQAFVQKPDTVCFKGHDLLNLPEEEILKEIKKSIIPENFIGQGTEAEVYRIKDTDYCVRIPYFVQEIHGFNYSKELTPIDKVNHIAAKLDFGASIMKYIEGITPKRYISNSHDRYILQEKISEMPIKSYSELLYQIADAIDNELLFDFSPGNLIINTEKNKLTAIDFFPISENPRTTKPLTEMYSILTCYGALEKTGKKIFDKITDTGLEEFKPNKIPCMDIELFDFVDLALQRNYDNHKYKNENKSEDINQFIHLRDSISEKLNNLKKIKKAEILDKSVSKDLEEKIQELKQIIRKIH